MCNDVFPYEIPFLCWLTSEEAVTDGKGTWEFNSAVRRLELGPGWPAVCLWGNPFTFLDFLGFTFFGFLVCKMDEDWVRETETTTGVSNRGDIKQGIGYTGVGKLEEQKKGKENEPSGEWLREAATTPRAGGPKGTCAQGGGGRGWRLRRWPLPDTLAGNGGCSLFQNPPPEKERREQEAEGTTTSAFFPPSGLPPGPPTGRIQN